MIEIKCNAPATIKLGELTPFQGDLKKRNLSDIQALASSLKVEGLLMPFVVWRHEGSNFILDGHGRLAALTELMLLDNSVAAQDFPCIEVIASDEIEAKKALLQITSQYGKITKNGAINFCSTLPEYHAPSIDKYVHKVVKRKKVEEVKSETILRISVETSKVEEVKALFSKVSYIRILN